MNRGFGTGKVDIGISGFGYKADRAEQFELSHGYQASSAAAHHTLLVPADKADEYKSLADFSGKSDTSPVKCAYN